MIGIYANLVPFGQRKIQCTTFLRGDLNHVFSRIDLDILVETVSPALPKRVGVPTAWGPSTGKPQRQGLPQLNIGALFNQAAIGDINRVAFNKLFPGFAKAF
ncbi:Uncharacterised protein [Serratia fonticola]|uniref:Uncharacterized protein n=1 Tax=Serratia fonticola TaxID=47917 RepID=A0A4U9URV2_SERFO|nr:Uncharacterised protein [Serratia fonticola]